MSEKIENPQRLGSESERTHLPLVAEGSLEGGSLGSASPRSLGYASDSPGAAAKDLPCSPFDQTLDSAAPPLKPAPAFGLVGAAAIADVLTPNPHNLRIKKVSAGAALPDGEGGAGTGRENAPGSSSTV